MTEQAIFRASEVLDMAIQIEHKGLSFYEACLMAEPPKEVLEVFQFMLGQEQKHIEIFTNMKKRLSEDYTLPESYPGEMRDYVSSFVKDKVFYEQDEVSQHVAQIDDISKAIQFAIEFEKRSIGFYSGIKDKVRSSEADVISGVIAQEHGHISRLEDLLRNMEK